tara:strand:- start:1105 stop:1308 length:204 start_codon:yes stop_codon:yes gene_type:complete
MGLIKEQYTVDGEMEHHLDDDYHYNKWLTTPTESEIVERGLWDHYSELPNPSWYEYKSKQEELDDKD